MFPWACAPKIAQVWYLKSKGCYKKLPVCLWSIHAIREGIFLAWVLTLPLTVTAAREAPGCQQLPWAEPGHGSVWDRGGDYITVVLLEKAPKICISQSSPSPAGGALGVGRGIKAVLLSVGRAVQVSLDMFIAHQHSWEPLSYHSLFWPPYLNSDAAGGFFDSWSRKLCFQKKFVNFSCPQYCCILGLCNLTLKNSCKCFSGSKLRPRQANYLFKVTEADVRVSKVWLFSAGLPTSDKGCALLEDFTLTHRLGGFILLGLWSRISPKFHLLARMFCKSNPGCHSSMVGMKV